MWKWLVHTPSHPSHFFVYSLRNRRWIFALSCLVSMRFPCRLLERVGLLQFENHPWQQSFNASQTATTNPGIKEAAVSSINYIIDSYGELLSVILIAIPPWNISYIWIVPESWQGGVAGVTHWAGSFKTSSDFPVGCWNFLASHSSKTTKPTCSFWSTCHPLSSILARCSNLTSKLLQSWSNFCSSVNWKWEELARGS